jgi:hypothetical protein
MLNIIRSYWWKACLEQNSCNSCRLAIPNAETNW